MSLHTIQINLPDPVFRRIKKRSELSHRSVAEEVLAVVTDTFDDDIPQDVTQELAQLDLFSDEELWAAAKITVSDEHAEKMQGLLEKQSREGLSQQDEQEVARLSHFFNRVMLVRAKAAALLKERGHDINSLLA
ncbi:MAG: hypothetical protein HUU38_13080 [Anaerolineales bacterium]|nr:hypothetical protein [Anaerolineales bacterium]